FSPRCAHISTFCGSSTAISPTASLSRRSPCIVGRDIAPSPRRGFLGAAVQLPIVAAVYGAVRSGIATGAHFGWIADLARPDGLLALAVAAITGLGAYLGTKYGATPARPGVVPLLIGTA